MWGCDDLKNLISFAEEDVSAIRGLLNGIVVSGIQNCKQIAMISQILDSGIPALVKDNDGKEEGGG